MSPSPAPSPSFLASLPGWAAELVRAVGAKQANVVILHGMASDLVPVGMGGREPASSKAPVAVEQASSKAAPGGEQASSKAAPAGASQLPASPGSASPTLAASGGSGSSSGSRFLPLQHFLLQR